MGFTAWLQKLFFFRSEKFSFDNSAICRIIEIYFLEAEKGYFYSTLSTLFALHSKPLLQIILQTNLAIN